MVTKDLLVQVELRLNVSESGELNCQKLQFGTSIQQIA